MSAHLLLSREGSSISMAMTPMRCMWSAMLSAVGIPWSSQPVRLVSLSFSIRCRNGTMPLDAIAMEMGCHQMGRRPKMTKNVERYASFIVLLIQFILNWSHKAIFSFSKSCLTFIITQILFTTDDIKQNGKFCRSGGHATHPADTQMHTSASYTNAVFSAFSWR